MVLLSKIQRCSFFLLFLCLAYGAEEDKFIQRESTLSNGVKVPLVGLGLGNLDPNIIPDVLSASKEEHMKYNLIDTSRESRNEKLIANLLDSTGRIGNTHVITKVWYTHLGYERTKISVEESLKDLAPFKNVHVLLHWARCDERIEWMKCEAEENALPTYVKEAGPSPMLNPSGKNAAWKGSWRALEELYDNYDQIASIGVSNFHPVDLKELVTEFRVKPHIYQGHLVQVFNEPELAEMLVEHKIFYQAFNVMHGTFNQLPDKPYSRYHLERISHDITQPDNGVTWPRLILGFLTQHNVGVVVRSSDENHLYENSPVSIAHVPMLSDLQSIEMKEILIAVLHGEDVPKPKDVDAAEAESASDTEVYRPVKTIFKNNLKDVLIDLFWVIEETGEHVPVGEGLEPGTSNGLMSYRGHMFHAKGSDGSTFNFVLPDDVQDEHFFSIEL